MQTLCAKEYLFCFKKDKAQSMQLAIFLKSMCNICVIVSKFDVFCYKIKVVLVEKEKTLGSWLVVI